MTALFLLLALQDWPQFRGPEGQGHSTATKLPLKWSESEAVAWKTPIDGLGWSSPVVGEGKIWLTTATQGGLSLRLVALDEKTGKLLHDLELFKLDNGLNILHVPYRGTAPLLAAAVAGEVQVLVDPMTTSLPHVLSEKLRALAVTSKARVDKLPNVPTVAEAGFPRMQNTFWLGVVVPAGTSPEIIGKLNAAFKDAVSQPETRARRIEQTLARVARR